MVPVGGWMVRVGGWLVRVGGWIAFSMGRKGLWEVYLFPLRRLLKAKQIIDGEVMNHHLTEH